MYSVNQYTDDLAERPGDLENGRSDVSDSGFHGLCLNSRATCRAFYARATPLPSARSNFPASHDIGCRRRMTTRGTK